MPLGSVKPFGDRGLLSRKKKFGTVKKSAPKGDAKQMGR